MATKMANGTAAIRMLMVGDVMLARGIDMIMPHSCPPQLHEGYIKDARDYVQFAVYTNGPISEGRGFEYIWGDALQILRAKSPDLRLVNLETSVTLSESHWPDKGIHYRMHPKNIKSLKLFGVDVCVLANNHVLDWGYPGLKETVETLCNAGIQFVGAGRNDTEAKKPAIFDLGDKGRVVVFAVGHMSSGVPDEWKPKRTKGGVNVIGALDFKSVETLKRQIKDIRQENDVVVLSIHWGGNWGFEVDDYHRQFAHDVIDSAGVDVVYGHSSHHIKGVEVYNGKLIVYGCGDWLNDYEGISGHEEFRGEFGLMYFVDVSTSDGRLNSLTMVPTEIKKLRVNRGSKIAVDWLEKTMRRECQKLGSDVRRDQDELKLVFH